MICLKCQYPNRLDAVYCDECGTPLEVACPSCLSSTRRGAKFCRQCGFPLLGAPTEPAAAQARPLVKRPDGRPTDALPVGEGERKQLTAMFADIKGSMELIAFRDPEDARQILDPVIESMVTAVRSFGGTVNRVVGDGIMALFGAPVAHEDHALRACQAALRIQELARRLVTEKELGADGEIDLKVRVGLNSGEVVFHYVHNGHYVDYGATGHAVHLAARMEQLARPGAVLITEATLRACAGMLDVTPLGAVPVKGLAEPQYVFELDGVRSRHARLAVGGPSGGLGRFIGRQAERSALEQAAQRAIRGEGRALALVGEPGIGKSRLARELVGSATGGRFLRLEAHGLSYGSRSAFLPIVSLLRAYMGVQSSDSIDQIAQRVSEKVSELNAALDDAVPALLWMLGVTGRSEPWDALDPQIKRARALDALKRLLVAQSRIMPLMLLFEDLQWIDVETRAALDVLVAAMPGNAICFVMTYRDEFVHQWRDHSHFEEIALAPLGRDTADEFLGDMLGRDASLESLKAVLIAKTGGNPFFLEESVRALVETGTVVGEVAYRIGKPVAELEIAPSVHAVLAARIDRLAQEDKALLQTASVIGQDVPLDILERVLDTDGAAIEGSLSRLRAANFLDDSKARPSTVSFKHALTHEVAYASLLRERRRSIHGKVLQAMERPGRDPAGEHVEILAHHALAAQSWVQAARYLRQAGNAAAVRSSFKDAEYWYRSAIQAWSNWPPGREKLELGFDLRIDLYAAVLTYGDIAPVFDVLGEAEGLATTIGDERRLSRVAGCLSMAYWWIADYPRALELGRQALAWARNTRRKGIELGVALMTLAWTESALGNFDAANEELEELLALAGAGPVHVQVRNGLPSSRVMALCWITLCCIDTGAFEEGIEAAREAVRFAEDIDQPWSRVSAYYALGSVLVRSGSLSDGIAVLEQGERLCAEYVIPGWATTISWILGHAYALAGEPHRGIVLLKKVIGESIATHAYTRLSLRVANLAEAVLLAGDDRQASDLAQEALRLARKYGEGPAEGQVLRLLGDIAAKTDAGEAASEGYYRQALAIARRYSMRPLEGECRDRLLALQESAALP